MSSLRRRLCHSQSIAGGFPYAADFMRELEKQPFVAAASETVQGMGLMTYLEHRLKSALNMSVSTRKNTAR